MTDYIFVCVVLSPVAQTSHTPSLHLLHLQPKIDITAATPTSTYTIPSTIGTEPRSIFTTFQESMFRSIPTPTKPQFTPPTINKILATRLVVHPTPLQHFE